MSLCGTADDHCCYLREHGVCQYVRAKDDPIYKWECSLRASRNNWDEVYASSEYQENVRPKLTEIGISQDCGNWPPLGKTCKTCGMVGSG